MSEDLTLTVLDWTGDEYEERYVLLLNGGDVDHSSINSPKFDAGVFSEVPRGYYGCLSPEELCLLPL